MTGIKLSRMRKGLSAQKLAAIVGVSTSTVRKWEKEIPTMLSAQYLIPLADALEVLVDDLVKVYDDDLLPKGHRVPYECKYPPGNCIDVYRRSKMLSYRQLAERMGAGSKQSASLNCRADIPNPKYIARLAELEGISPTEFEQRYAVEKGVA